MKLVLQFSVLLLLAALLTASIAFAGTLATVIIALLLPLVLMIALSPAKLKEERLARVRVLYQAITN